jgi:hypothetical protein
MKPDKLSRRSGRDAGTQATDGRPPPSSRSVKAGETTGLTSLSLDSGILAGMTGVETLEYPLYGKKETADGR